MRHWSTAAESPRPLPASAAWQVQQATLATILLTAVETLALAWVQVVVVPALWG